MADTVIDLSEQGQYHQGQGDTTSSFFDSDTAPELGKNPELGKTSGDAQGLLDGVQSRIGQEMAGQLWQAGKQSTQKFINMYAHIDFLRPYFDVEPREFRNRLLRSFIPSKAFGAPQEVSSELYGPLMLTLTLVAVLLYGMKTGGHEVEEGTLIGTAMIICFSYWLGISSLMFFIGYLCNAHFSFVQVLSLTGYSQSGTCSVLLLSTLLDHYGSPSAFWPLWLVLGGCSALKMVGVYISRTWGLKDGVILGSLSVVFHMLFTLYLRLQYRKVYEGTCTCNNDDRQLQFFIPHTSTETASGTYQVFTYSVILFQCFRMVPVLYSSGGGANKNALIRTLPVLSNSPYTMVSVGQTLNE